MALRDLLGILRVIWWVRWAGGAGDAELRIIASAGDDVLRLVRAARFEAGATTWQQARLAMQQVTRLGEEQPWADALLRAGASRVLSVKGIPPPPLQAYASGAGDPPSSPGVEPATASPPAPSSDSPKLSQSDV